jgi:hypothetical protein
MAKATAKIDRCAELTILDLQRIIDRAQLCWEADRRKVADDLGARLAKDPARVSQALSRSRQGADWKIERWEGLGEALSSNGGWDESQRRLAFDLLGVAPDLRNGSKRVPPEHDATGLAGLVAREIGLLCQAQELSLDALDEAEWSMAAAGMPPEEDACAARLRRYEASARRALLWAHSELRRVRDGLPPSPASGPARDSSRPEPAATQSPLPTLPTLTQSAVDYHVRRSQLVTLEMLSPPEDVTPADEAPADEAPADEAPVVETPVDANKPAVDAPVSPSPLNRAMTSAFSTRAPRNRRERLAREKRARRAVEHSTR